MSTEILHNKELNTKLLDINENYLPLICDSTFVGSTVVVVATSVSIAVVLRSRIK